MLNNAIPGALNDVVMKTLAPEVTDRYQRAETLMADLKEIRAGRRVTPAADIPAGGHGDDARGTGGADGEIRDIRARLRSRATPPAGFCWHCRKPLHAKSDHCPFCGEAQ